MNKEKEDYGLVCPVCGEKIYGESHEWLSCLSCHELLTIKKVNAIKIGKEIILIDECEILQSIGE
jgi:hypothetical protein